MAGWGDVLIGSKNNGLNQPKAQEPCTMHWTCQKKSCRITYLASKQLWQFEQRVLQTGSSEGRLQWQREGQQLRSLHPIHTCVAQHVIRVWIGPGTWDLESTVAHGFVKQGLKVLLHHVVYGPLQTSRCPVLQSLNEPHWFIPGIPVYFGPKQPRTTSADGIATCLCILGVDLLRQLYILPYWDRSCRSNFLLHSVTVYWHGTNQSQHWPL